MLKVFEQREGIVVFRDRPGGLEKTSVVSVWMKKDRWRKGRGKHLGEERS